MSSCGPSDATDHTAGGSPATEVITTAVPPERHGVASVLNEVIGERRRATHMNGVDPYTPFTSL